TDWDERTDEESAASSIAQRGMAALSQVKDAFIFAMAPPAMPELGIASGYSFFLQDNGGLGQEALPDALNQLLGMPAQSELLASVRPNGQEDSPQFRVNVDVARAAALGLSRDAINTTLAAACGGRYIDDFIARGRVKRVYVQA